MPKTPNATKLYASTMDILNTIRANASANYQERVPEATRDNIREVGNPIVTYKAIANEFLEELVNRIARVLVTSKSYQNPLKPFKKGIMEYGESVEEIFVEIAKAQAFDPNTAQTDVFKRVIPNVKAVFHTMNTQDFYKVTISNEQLRQAFLTEEGVTDLIAKIVDSLYTGAEYDEFLIMKQTIADAISNGEMYPIKVDSATAENAKAIVSAIKGASNKIEFMSNSYNPMGVVTHTPKNSQVLIIDAAFDAVIDVNVLAAAFNMDKAEFMGRRVLIDDFAELTGIVACLVDEDFFMVFDNFIGFTENYNGQGLYWNYFYHNWKTYSRSPFANAIVFTTETGAVTAVTITPSSLTIAKGQSASVTTEVTSTGYVSKGVTFALSGTDEVKSTVDNMGNITIATDETNTTLTLTATSVYDTSVSGTATITIS